MQNEQAASGSGLTLRDVLTVVSVYVVCLAVVAGVPHPQAGFPLDDSWIHQVVARNLAQDGTLGFIPGVRSSGSSSLLWTFVLAAQWKLLPGIGPGVYSAGVSVCLLAATGLALLAMARRDGLPESACWVWALTPALDGNFLWLGMIGMEHLLFATLSVVGVYLWFQGGRRSAVSAAMCLGALSLTRPEGLVLAVVAGLAAGWARRTRVDVAILGVVVSLCVFLSLLANFITSKSWLPTTYAGRKWLYFGSDKVPLGARIEFPYVLFRSLLQPWAVFQTHPLYVFNALIFLLSAVGVWMLWTGRRRRCGFLVLWSFVHIAIYSAMLPTRSHGGRYQPVFLLLSFPLMFLGLRAVLERALPRDGVRMRAVVLGGVCLACGGSSLMAWRRVTAAGIAHIEATHARMGRYLAQELPAESRVAALDIGRMGFIYGGRLGDMGGLTDSAFLPYMREHRVFDYLRERRIEYLVWPANEDGSLDIPQILSFTPENRQAMHDMVTFCAPHEEYAATHFVTLDAAACQKLFRLELGP